MNEDLNGEDGIYTLILRKLKKMISILEVHLKKNGTYFIMLSISILKMGVILKKSGIQQHICDVLEGGKAAFELRTKKYRL